MELELSSETGIYGAAGIFALSGAVFLLLGLLANRILRPDRPNPEKMTPYECGEDPVGDARIRINPRFYVIALAFLIFEVEVLFFFPWATVFADESLIAEASEWGWFALVEMGVFAFILIAGLAYLWVNDDLDWIKPQPLRPESESLIPESEYAGFNQRISEVNTVSEP